MSDLNVMMREHAVTGLQVQLDAAVTAGDTVAARKISEDLAKLAVSTAPKAPPFGQEDIMTELNKLDWFGVDPKKSGRVIALGKDMNPKKFATAAEFAAAIVKVVDEEFKPAVVTTEDPDPEDEGAEDEGADTKKVEPKKKRTDGPGDADALGRAVTRRAGPWQKLTEAPADVQKEITRTADKFAPKTKEGREGFINKALEAHYAQHQRSKGKK